MVLFPNDKLDFYVRGTLIVNNEGGPANYQYTLYKSDVRADVQPIGADSVVAQNWGLENYTADDRIVTIDNDANIKNPMKAISQKTGIAYIVMGDQPWPRHTNLLLNPLQGGQTQ